MDPVAVRERILREHTALRQALAALGEALDGAEAGDRTRLDEARLRTAELCSMLAEHTALEDRILAPALREADSWGDVRADRLLLHHIQQRDEFDELAQQALTLEPATFSSRAKALIQDVLEDMLYEEADVVTDRILRNDVIAIDAEAG